MSYSKWRICSAEGAAVSFAPRRTAYIVGTRSPSSFRESAFGCAFRISGTVGALLRYRLRPLRQAPKVDAQHHRDLTLRVDTLPSHRLRPQNHLGVNSTKVDSKLPLKSGVIDTPLVDRLSRACLSWYTRQAWVVSTLLAIIRENDPLATFQRIKLS